MSLVAHWKLNDLSTLLVDDTGNGHDLVNINGTSVFNDPTYGTVASFDSTQTQRLQLDVAPNELVGAPSHTFSFWAKLDSGNPSDSTNILYSQNDYRVQYQFSTSVLILVRPTDFKPSVAQSIVNTWTYYTITYDGTLENLYIDGVFVDGRTTTITRPAGVFQIGGGSLWPTYLGLYGLMTDFRIYNDALSSSEITSNFTNGANYVPLPITVTPRVSSILSTIEPVAGAIGYRLTSQKTGSSQENIVSNNFTDLQQSIINLTPETEYTIRIYSTTDGVVYTLVEESIVTTLPNLGSNHDKNDYLGSSGRFGLSTLESVLISDVINDVFNTGDEIDINISGKTKKSTFVNRGDAVDVSDTDAIIAPFSQNGGPGQYILVTLSDSTSVDVSYDENSKVVTISGTAYDEGDSLVLDGKKVTIVDI